MKMNQTAFALTAVVTASGCGSNPLYTVTAYSAQQSAGIVYVLPKTVLTVELDVESTTSEKGEYAEYNTVLGLPPAKMPADSKPSFKSVRVTPLAIPDEANRFVVAPTEHGLMTDRQLQFVVTESGLLTNSEASADNRTAETAVVVLKTGASILGSAFGFSTIGSAADAVAKTPESSPKTPKTDDSPVAKSGDCVTRLKAVDEPKRTEVCRAFGRLQVLVEERDRMITKTAANIMADSLKLQLDATTKEIESLQSLFFTSVSKKVRTWKFFIDPGTSNTDPGTSITCFTLNDKGTPTHPPNQKNAACDDKSVQLTVPSKTAAPCPANDGIVYRVPMEGEYEASLGGRQLTVGRASFPQFGLCASAPNHVKGDGRVVVELSPATGMLTKVSVEGTADYEQVVTATGETATQVLDAAKDAADARAAKRAAEKTANDPLTLKKKELEMLEIQRQIACYETLGQPCSSAAGASAE